MTTKNVSVSLRLDAADVDFIDRLQIGDATNQSEKLRAIIEQARQREVGRHSYTAGLRMIDELLDPVRMDILDQERREGVHSELLSRIYEWLPDIVAFVLANVDQEANSDERITLTDLESGVADRVFRLIEATLRLAVSTRNPCYDHEAISRRLQPVIELLDVAKVKA